MTNEFQKKAYLHVPGKPPTQSGVSKEKLRWVLEFASTEEIFKNEVMGWNAGGDVNSQVKLRFNSLQEAEDYAKQNNIKYEIIKPKSRKVIKKSYEDNFKDS